MVVNTGPETIPRGIAVDPSTRYLLTHDNSYYWDYININNSKTKMIIIVLK